VAGMNAYTYIASVVADSDWHHDGFWFFRFGLLWLVALGALIWFLARRRDRRSSSAREILADRFARGEIDAQEYRERLAELGSSR
jgi:putative membrane protein